MILQPQLITVADGVFAWIGLAGDSNAGAIATRDGLLVIDAQQHLPLAQAFKDALKSETGLPVSALINTHCHLDHTAGNILFDHVPIIAHTRTLSSLQEMLGPLHGDAWTVTDFETRARLLWGGNLIDLVASDDPAQGWFRERVGGPEYERIRIKPPSQVFDNTLEFCLPSDRVRLQYRGRAHCDGDITIHLPGRKVIFLGDLMFYRRFPWLGDCDLEGWIDRLGAILELDVDVVIPGHGPPTDRREVARMHDLLVAMRRAVLAAIAVGASEEATMQTVHLNEFADLPRYREWRGLNVRAAYRQLR